MSRKKPPARRRASTAARRGRRRSWQVWAGIVVVVVAVVVGIAIQSSRSAGSGTVVRPAHALGPNDGETMGKAPAPVLVEEYGDFQCPNCGNFERQVGPTIRQLVGQGRIRFEYHPIAFIGPESTSASNAAVCAGDQGKFWPYHDKLFAEQGPENSGALSNARLVQIGQQVGVTGDRFTTCVDNGTYDGWVKQITDDASRRGVNATPTIFVDGHQVDSARTASGLQAAVNAALQAK